MRSRTGNLEEHSSQQTLNAMQSQLQLLKAQNEALVAKVAGFEAAPKAVQPPEVEFENQKARNEVRAGVNTGSSVPKLMFNEDSASTLWALLQLQVVMRSPGAPT